MMVVFALTLLVLGVAGLAPFGIVGVAIEVFAVGATGKFPFFLRRKANKARCLTIFG